MNQPITTTSADTTAQTQKEGAQGLHDHHAQRPLRESVAMALEHYFEQLEGQPVSDLYAMVLGEVEGPLLETVMRHTQDNQTQASAILGLNRGTLRKKLKQYGLLDT